MENRSSLFGIIAILIGAVGVGLGMFSVVNFQLVQGPQGLPGQDGQDGQDGIGGIDGLDGINGTDGTDGQDGINGLDGINAPGYYCNSGIEVQQALDSIGSSSGTIIINVSIVLNAPIQINGGGNYVIQGTGTTIDCGDDRTAFNITNVETCTIRDLKIDATDISATTEALLIKDTNNNPVYIQNVQINGADLGNGIMVDSDNVWIQNCYLTDFETGIYMNENSESCHIFENSIQSMAEYGILVKDSKYNSLIGNRIKNTSADIGLASGIYLDHAGYNTLSDNVIDGVNSYSSSAYGIFLDSSYNNILSGNGIYKVHAGDQAFGIMVYSSGYSTLNGNVIADIHADNQAHGIRMAYVSSRSTLSGNLVIKIASDNSYGYGIRITIGNYITISGSMIEEVDAYLDAYGIYMGGAGDCDLNTIIGNLIAAIQPTGSGYGDRKSVV